MYGVMKLITKFQNQLDANNESALTTAMQYQAACVDIRTSRQSDAFRANGKWKDLTNQNPDPRSPGGGEEGDVQAGEDDEAFRSSIATLTDGAHDGNDKFANEHASGAVHQKHAATKLLNSPERNWRRANVNSCGSHGNDEGILDPNSLEEGGTIVKDYSS
jgi:hypothetical protein